MEEHHGSGYLSKFAQLQAYLLQRRREKANHTRPARNAAARKKAARKRSQASRRRNRQ